MPAGRQSAAWPTASRRPGDCLKRRAWKHTLARSRCDLPPSTRALLHIRVVALRILTIVPGGLCGGLCRGRLDIDRRWGRDDNRWVAIWHPIWSPVGFPERPDGEHNMWSDKDMRAMPEAMATTPRVPWYGACYEQCHYYDDLPQPLLPHARCLVCVAHRDPLSHIIVFWFYAIPYPATQRDT